MADHEGSSEPRYRSEYGDGRTPGPAPGATRRFAADIIDGFLLALLFAFVTFLVALAHGALVNGSISEVGVPPRPSRAMLGFNVVLNGGLSLAYWAIVEGPGGQSVGKRLTEIRVEHADGEPITRRDAILRKLPFYTPLAGTWAPGAGAWFVVLGAATMLAGLVSYLREDGRRGFHDRWVDTQVVPTGE